MPALRASATAFVGSRVLVFAVGVLAATTGGAVAAGPEGPLTEPFGEIGDTLVAPFSRFDAAWYVYVADHGYPDPGVRAFFPLYPLLIKVLSFVTGSYLVAGIAISFAALLVALVLLYRLTALELGELVASRTVLVTAFSPLAFFLSAVYTEALFLALTVGAFYSARTGRWAWAGMLGAAASATRSAGVLLLVPLAIIYFSERGRLRRDALWLLAVPLGLLAFAAYLGIAEGEPLGMLEGQEQAHRQFAFPLVGLGEGIAQGVEDVADAVSGQTDGFGHDAHQLPWIAFAGVATVGVLRRLPAAYGAWTVVCLLLPLSAPLEGHPLTSFGRFVLVLFPLWMWLAAWSTERGWDRAVLAVSTLLLAYYTWLFVDWRFVG